MAYRQPSPTNHSVSSIKSKLFEPALSTHYEVDIVPPGGATTFINKIPLPSNLKELLKLSCCEATLPGSSIATHELNNDFTGVTQRHAYRRLYDDRIDLTFYVTTFTNPQNILTSSTGSPKTDSYTQIRYFERWMQYVTGEQIADSQELNKFYRVAYPKNYKTTLGIQKFERTAKPRIGKDAKVDDKSVNGSYLSNASKLQYIFINAFPISIGSIPVSYDSASLLKCTVSFTYDRYVMADVSNIGGNGSSSDPEQPSTSNTFNLNNIKFNPNAFDPNSQALNNLSYSQNFTSQYFGNTNSVIPSSIDGAVFSPQEVYGSAASGQGTRITP